MSNDKPLHRSMGRIARTATSDRNRRYGVRNYGLPVQGIRIGLRRGGIIPTPYSTITKPDTFTMITDREYCYLGTYRKGKG